MTHLQVPHLTTALKGPLPIVEGHLQEHQAEIESWFRARRRDHHEPFYTSVDIRNAGYKIAPVDTNLFPAGFNNLNPEFEPLCIQAVQLAIERLDLHVDRIMIVPESHTRNLFYLESVAILQEIIEKAGFEVRIGSLLPDLGEPMTVNLESGRKLRLEPLQRKQDRLHIAGFTPDLVLLNNDLSGGRPAILEGLAQRVMPPLNMGWSDRVKSSHFTHYQAVAEEFCKPIGLEPWLISPLFRNCGEVDFMKKEGETCLQINTERLLRDIQKKYDEYEVKCKPFVIIKADAGTYGMSVMTVKSPDEIVALNRKQRTHMAKTKEGMKVTKVIIQEGVYTHETWGEQALVAEPVVYLIGHNVVGGFYRVHSTRRADENLNAPGMHFEPLAFDACCISPDKSMAPDAHPNRFYAYGVIGRLAMLAASLEMAGCDE